MDANNNYAELLRRFSGRIKKNEPLKNHTTINIGGPADLFFETGSTEDLLQILKTAVQYGIPTVLMGGGSNLLVDDKGYRGLIVKFINDDEPKLDFPLITVSAGYSLKSALEFAADNSLSGLEFLAGIPGSVGGAVYMNAGAYGRTIGEILKSAVIVNENHKMITVDVEYFGFKYRSSKLQEQTDTVVSVTLEVAKGNKDEIWREYDRIIGIRETKHPKPTVPCAGSYFKNLPPDEPGGRRRPAGYFLEQAGAKSMKSGGAEVYKKHANIIINSGKATAADVLKLAEQMKKAVYDKFQIKLHVEVRFLDSVKGIMRK
ncbi:UDP-N-acetylmuramate dehydrogenase [candidate division KSB1 bacterium]|nr:UDP-N-acetylmuramate dehydrogenase [candidate division KSB1 bacterium]